MEKMGYNLNLTPEGVVHDPTCMNARSIRTKYATGSDLDQPLDVSTLETSKLATFPGLLEKQWSNHSLTVDTMDADATDITSV